MNHYGHFFYRIPNGESAADAYDRISGFNESLWRQFGEENFPSVCVLVTHGLMTRVFLMKWYHWSVEYFEDLRNINHCEFIIMKHNLEDGKYDLENHLRTWSELHTQEKLHTPSSTPKIPSTRRRWGGCPEGCNHGRHKGSVKRKNALHPIPTIKTDGDVDGSNEDPKKSKDRVATHRKSELQDLHQSIGQMMARPTQLLKLEASKRDKKSKLVRVLSPDRLQVIRAGRDGGGSMSGANSQVESSDEEECYEEISDHENDADVESPVQLGHSRSFADALGDQSETDPDDDETLQVIRKLEKEEKSVQGSVY
ncbi:MAG: hypothetical protein M1814_001175 [Vezdaea aestivalis]|nr:MAG: hypothetical protein M1814_001175 [Vezdaea aestivalis]